VKTSKDKIEFCIKALGKKIQLYRKEKKMTLEQLGFSIGLDKSAMHHIENGKPITFITLIKIAAVLEISISKLVEDLPSLSTDDIF
jgi:transcriptional regulator with XRE-family HTH domain